MDVSENNGTPKSSILLDLIGCSIINHPFGGTPIFGNIHISMVRFCTPQNGELSNLTVELPGGGAGGLEAKPKDFGQRGGGTLVIDK